MVLFTQEQLAVLVRPILKEHGIVKAAKICGVSRETLLRVASEVPVSKGSLSMLSAYFSGSNQPQPEAPAH